MKSSDLHTIYAVNVRNYQMEKLPTGKYRHSFSPESTNRVYEFLGNEVPLAVNGEQYNIGYTPTPDGRFIIDPAAFALASAVNPTLSYLATKSIAKERRLEEQAKNDSRVVHQATDNEYYWAKKHAWRMYGAFMAHKTFISYLDEIGHKSVDCMMHSPDHPPSESRAYAETGLEDAAFLLLSTAVKVGKSLYKSENFSKKFTINGLSAIKYTK